MLNMIRNAARSWLSLVLIGLLVVAFAIWGVEDMFRGGASNTVAKVGERNISADAFVNEFRRAVQRISRESGVAFTTPEARALGIDRQILDNMISTAAIDQAADDLGLTTSDATLRTALLQMQDFWGPAGRFDRNVYRELLAANQLTPTMFETRLREDLTRQTLLDAVLSGVHVPRALARTLFTFYAEQRTARYLVLQPALAGEIETPDEETLRAYYEENAETYTAPEYRTISYIGLVPDEMARQIEIDEDDVRATYEFRLDTFRTPERRVIRQLVLNTREEAEQALARLEEGQNIVEVASAFGRSEADILLGGVTKEELFDRAVADAAFALEEPGITGIVEGQFGFVIAEVEEIEPEELPSYEEMADEIRKTMQREEAISRLYDYASRIDRDIATGSRLEEAAEAVGVAVRRIEAVDRAGRGRDGRRIPGLPETDEFLRAAFDMPTEMESDPIETRENEFFVLRVDAVQPSALQPFENVRDEVLRAWRDDVRDQRLRDLARSLNERLENGEAFETIAGEFGRSVLTTPTPLQRGRPTEIFSASVVAQLFASEPGRYIYGRVPDGASYVIATVDSITIPDPDEYAMEVAQLHNHLRSDFARDTVDSFVAGLRDRHGVEINERTISRALGDEAF
jgi:peptidyl-prolyl cis-trans isomerase D